MESHNNYSLSFQTVEYHPRVLGDRGEIVDQGKTPTTQERLTQVAVELRDPTARRHILRSLRRLNTVNP